MIGRGFDSKKDELRPRCPDYLGSGTNTKIIIYTRS